MATTKSYSDLEQSRILAEILPLESADMKILPFTERVYRVVPINDIAVCGREDEIYAWSLAALIDVLPNGIVMNKDSQTGRYHFSSKYIGTYVTADNPVDACVAMIEKLHELNLL